MKLKCINKKYLLIIFLIFRVRKAVEIMDEQKKDIHSHKFLKAWVIRNINVGSDKFKDLMIRELLFKFIKAEEIFVNGMQIHKLVFFILIAMLMFSFFGMNFGLTKFLIISTLCFGIALCAFKIWMEIRIELAFRKELVVDGFKNLNKKCVEEFKLNDIVLERKEYRILKRSVTFAENFQKKTLKSL